MAAPEDAQGKSRELQPREDVAAPRRGHVARPFPCDATGDRRTTECQSNQDSEKSITVKMEGILARKETKGRKTRSWPLMVMQTRKGAGDRKNGGSGTMREPLQHRAAGAGAGAGPGALSAAPALIHARRLPTSARPRPPAARLGPVAGPDATRPPRPSSGH